MERVMTRQRLEDYPYIVSEIRELEELERIRAGGTAEVPARSDPYAVRATAVCEVPYLRENTERLEELYGIKEEIETYIQHLPTMKQRRIVEMRILRGLSWCEIAAKMGYRHSADSVRMTYQRIFK